MSLIDEVKAARKKVVTDGYEMSLGEVVNLYKNGELKIDPVFQRLFRWADERKTRFIESLLLGIPVPPIFVFQTDTGVWELIDGLQRLSTVLQLTGDLKDADGNTVPPLVLEGTSFLPSLDGKRWLASTDESDDGLGATLQIEIKRCRLRVEILKSDSDDSAKFELFQRLNTGGITLSEQEVRNSIAVSINAALHRWLTERANDSAFKETTDQTEVALEAQFGVELVLRFVAFRHVPYNHALDIHEYLDKSLISIARDKQIDWELEKSVFQRTFSFIKTALGDRAFKRWNGSSFSGKFLLSVYEVIAIGISKNIDAIEALDDAERASFIVERAKALWTDETFKANSGAGVRGTTRLARLLPMSGDWMRPNV